MPTTLSKEPSRAEVLEFLFTSSRYGNLGLFVGAGFSKAVLNDGEEDIALSWGDLLEAAAKMMKIEYASLKRDGASYPEMASALCKSHSETNGIPFDDSAAVLKRTLKAATAWYPAEPRRGEFAQYLRALAPSWIVTTNYDQVLECLLSGKSVSLGPKDAFSSSKGVIPIFHLHGARTIPEDIIITQEDYVALFRPAEYRQVRLALTIKESTTCLLGYGLGDVNVLTALDWSKNVYKKDQGDYPHEVIQIYRTKAPSPDPYRSRDGMVIVEVSEISQFCKEYADAATEWKKERKQRRAKVKQVAGLLSASEPATIKRFIDDDPWRRKVLGMLTKFSVDLVRDFESFLEVCFEETRQRSSKDGAFEAYATDLHITLDILTAFPYASFPPALFPLAATNLNRLAAYIGTGKGYSWAANNTWNARRGELPEETVAELQAIARQYYYSNLSYLLKGM
jgi:SIR2-like domain